MRSIFHLILIKPTHYDDDGYPLQWRRFTIPSNALASLIGLARDCRDRQVLGQDTEIRIHAFDETNSRVRPAQIIRQIRADGGKCLVCLVGVQSNQFPRAIDLAGPFLKAGLTVCLGGFHVTGSLAMLDGIPSEIAAAADMGISYFLGEAEDGRLDEVLRDASAGQLKPRYDYRDKLPNLQGAPVPMLGPEQVALTYDSYSSFDLGRGCPFQCSFCTIINVQGRVSRYRSADDLERIIRANHAIGVHKFFLTDDNLARNRNWESCFDRLIELREREGIKLQMAVQVDTLCHRIPNFIEKAVKAGVDQVFVGLENINPDSLASAKKGQNKISEYRELFLKWKQHPVIVTAGYIIGFPNDTPESVLHDMEIIKRELPIDIMYFSFLTPLPGSEDHQMLIRKGAWLDPDLNKYDLNHRVSHHPNMSDAEWDRAYDSVWEAYYTFEHMETVLRRMVALGSNKRRMTVSRLLYYRNFRKIYGCHPLEGGMFRVKSRTDRRPGLPIESPLTFYPRRVISELANLGIMVREFVRLRRMLSRIRKDPQSKSYRDLALTPATTDTSELALFQETRGGKAHVEKGKRQRAIIAAVRSKAGV